MQERYQRAQLQDLGSKWKVFYWDYTRTPRQRRTKSWAKSRVMWALDSGDVGRASERSDAGCFLQ